MRPTTPAEDSNGIEAVCGDTSYSIHSDNSGSSFTYNAAWAVITGPSSDTYTLTIDANADDNLIANEASVTIPLYLKATLDDYTSYTRESYTLINIVINEITCSCTALAWDNPSSGVVVSSAILAGASSSQTLAPPVENTGARTTDRAFDKCYLNSQACATTGSFTSLQWDNGTGAATLPSWITFTSSGSTS